MEEPKLGHYSCKCVGKLPGNGPTFDAGCSDRTAQGKFVCTILEPNVAQRETSYPNVQFFPGDMVVVQANGCVQSGGSGTQTWKRYVNPDFDIDPNRTTFHGLVRIPGTQEASDLVEIRSVTNRFLLVSEGLPLSEYYLHLGYDDTNYTDNSYLNHDDGTHDQCKEGIDGSIYGGPAFATVTIYRNHPLDTLSSPFDFDLLPNSTATDRGVDVNGLLYNPYWSWQESRGKQGVPDPSICHNFSHRDSTAGIPSADLRPDLANCMDQADSSMVDLPAGPEATICNVGAVPYFGSTFAGHINWFPVTLEGQAGWGKGGAPKTFPWGDDDYTFTFTSGQAGDPLGVSSYDSGGHLHVEFDDDETVQNFMTPEWRQFRDAVHNGDVPTAASLFDGHTILTGMFGLDGEHDWKPELHPLFAMATQLDSENAADDEVWLMFVRNEGDEGFCSGSIWNAGFDQYTFRLPWRGNERTVDVDRAKTHFEVSEGNQTPTVTYIAPPSSAAGVYVTFQLGPPIPGNEASLPFVDGALHLVWSSKGPILPPIVGVSGSGSSGQGASHGAIGPGATGLGVKVAHPLAIKAQTAGSDQKNEDDQVEAMVGGAIAKLTPQQREQVLRASVATSGAAVAVHALPPIGPVLKIEHAPGPGKKTVVAYRTLRLGPASLKSQREEAQIRLLCAVTHNAPEGLPAGLCQKIVAPPPAVAGQTPTH